MTKHMTRTREQWLAARLDLVTPPIPDHQSVNEKYLFTS